MHARTQRLAGALAMLAAGTTLALSCAVSEPRAKSDAVSSGTEERPPAAAGGAIEVLLCDGESTVQVQAEEAMTREDGQRISDALMSQWLARHPDRQWEAAVRERHAIVPPADNSDVLEGEQREGHVYKEFTRRDVETWRRETGRLVAAGARVFHSADELESTIAVSCDMCHPDASNTHPETYPKFQTQLGRVALLRDMINWCVEHPVRADPLAPDDPRMRAMEAYILAQRRGVVLNYGKH